MRFKELVFTQVVVIKNGVGTVLKPSAEIRAAWLITDEVSKQTTSKQIIITSILDGKHRSNSKHYTGNAFDIRTRIYTAAQIAELMAALKPALGKHYDVVNEKDHIHIEFDPKK